MQAFFSISPALTELLFVALVSILTSGAAIMWFVRQPAPRRTSAYPLIHDADRKPVFLFDQEILADATPAAHEMLRGAPSAATKWQQFSALFSPRFPTLNEDLTDLDSTGEVWIAAMSPGDTGIIHAEWWDGLMRLEIGDSTDQDNEIPVDGQCLRASEEELALLRYTSDVSPVLAWQFSHDGTLIWANDRYLEVAASLSDEDRTHLWPPENILPELDTKAADGSTHRLCLKQSDQGRSARHARWFDCRKTTWRGTTVCIAVESGAEVNARAALEDFVQTLTKTFAHLSAGLAIFDKSRRLVLFNPALTDLTGLDVLFLSQKPELISFLDELREKRMIPEPKNYTEWRNHIQKLETQAVDGTYEETWSLPSGRTYKISGRPNPNGAIAFQFEDITPEITLTRQFRAELELSQSVIDVLPDAMVVFSHTGTLTLSNKAYAELWGYDPGSGLDDLTHTEALSRWVKATCASPVWSGVERSICRMHNREPWSAEARMEDGRHLFISVTPLTSGATLVHFSTTGSQDAKNREPVWKTTRSPQEA